MILIESIKIRQVDGSVTTVVHPPDPSVLAGGDVNPAGVCTTETVVGHRFVTEDGRTTTLGMTREVRDVLGPTLGAFQSQRDTISMLRDKNWILEIDLNNYKRMTWRQRLGFLFNRGGRR